MGNKSRHEKTQPTEVIIKVVALIALVIISYIDSVSKEFDAQKVELGLMLYVAGAEVKKVYDGYKKK